jgi:hypothetical protein
MPPGPAAEPGPTSRRARRGSFSVGVRLGAAGVAAAVRQRPDQGARLGLIEAPSRCLFRLMVAAAGRVQLALAGPAPLVKAAS